VILLGLCLNFFAVVFLTLWLQRLGREQERQRGLNRGTGIKLLALELLEQRVVELEESLPGTRVKVEQHVGSKAPGVR
jgi:hypothetical protein